MEIVNRPGARAVPSDRCRVLLRGHARQLGLAGGEVTVLFCEDAEMAEMNQRCRGARGPTDVLSFPSGPSNPSGPAGGTAHLGDIAISTETAGRQAKAGRAGFEHEVMTLLTHGFLHLLGYDHETDGGEMMRLQQRLLRRRPAPHARARGGAIAPRRRKSP